MGLDDVLDGVNLIWNNKFDEAEKVFADKKAKDPRAALHYAEVIFVRTFITASQKDAELALDRLQAARTLAENHIKALEKLQEPGEPTKAVVQNQQYWNRLLDVRVVYGDCLYMIAIMQIYKDEKVKGVFNIRKSHSAFSKCLAIVNKNTPAGSTDFFDARLVACVNFGIGVFLFGVSIIPQKYLKFVEMAGFKADREGGLKSIRDCYESNGIRAPFATAVLLFNNLILPRGLSDPTKFLKEADEICQQTIARYPQGSLIYVMASHSARKQCKIEQGIEFMELALKNSEHLSTKPLIYIYELANCYCMKMNFAKAASLFEPLIKEETLQVRSVCAIQLAACYVMLNKPVEALTLFKQAQTFPSKKSHFDPIVKRQAKRFMENGGFFSAFELLYLRRDLAKMTPIMGDVLASLEKQASACPTQPAVKKAYPEGFVPGAKSGLLATPKEGGGRSGTLTGKSAAESAAAAKNAAAAGLSKLGGMFGKKKVEEVVDLSWDDRASYLLLKGSMLKASGKLDEAIALFHEVIEMGDLVVEKLYVPYALYELGESYFMQGNNPKAMEFITKCSKQSGYDWEEPLRVRLRVTVDQLKKGLSAEESAKLEEADKEAAAAAGAASPGEAGAGNNNNAAEDDSEDV